LSLHLLEVMNAILIRQETGSTIVTPLDDVDRDVGKAQASSARHVFLFLVAAFVRA